MFSVERKGLTRAVLEANLSTLGLGHEDDGPDRRESHQPQPLSDFLEHPVEGSRGFVAVADGHRLPPREVMGIRRRRPDLNRGSSKARLRSAAARNPQRQHE